MAEAVRMVRIDVEDYLAAERLASVRHECVDGELFAMAGASRTHNALAANLKRHLGNQLAESTFRIVAPVMTVRLTGVRNEWSTGTWTGCRSTFCSSRN